MKAAWLAVMAVLGGCASVADIEKTPETMSVISGKSPKEYASCFVAHLSDSRDPSVIEKKHDGYRIIVPQKLSKDPAAVVIVDERSSGSSIKVHESMSNVPIRPGDVRQAAESCISG
jgi:hypothetical protein